MSSSGIREGVEVEPLLRHIERSQVRWFGDLDASWARFSGRLYLSAGLGTPCCPQDKLEKVARERKVWASLLRLVPLLMDVSTGKESYSCFLSVFLSFLPFLLF